MFIANSKRIGRQQIQIYIPALCPQVLDLPNTCLFGKVTLACGRFPYSSRALPACFGVNYIHKNRLMQPWGDKLCVGACVCVCVCMPLGSGMCVYMLFYTRWVFCGPSELRHVMEKKEKRQSSQCFNPRGRRRRKLLLMFFTFRSHEDNAAKNKTRSQWRYWNIDDEQVYFASSWAKNQSIGSKLNVDLMVAVDKMSVGCKTANVMYQVRCWGIEQDNWKLWTTVGQKIQKCQPASGVRRKVKGSPECLYGFHDNLSCTSWDISIWPVSRPTDRPTSLSLFSPLKRVRTTAFGPGMEDKPDSWISLKSTFFMLSPRFGSFLTRKR